MSTKQPGFGEQFAATNAGFFFREFSFQSTLFAPAAGSELELADHVVLLEDTLLLFQLKDRGAPTEDAERERSWYEKKVLRDATRQMRDTLSYLRQHAIEVINDRGRKTSLSGVLDSPGRTTVKLVVFNPGPSLPEECRRKKFHRSDTAGFIHLIPAADWLGVLQTFVTPTEIFAYLAARERICERFTTHADAVSEQALVGQCLIEATDELPADRFTLHTTRLIADVSQFQMSWMLHLFADRIEPLDPTMRMPNAMRDRSDEYYRILAHLARLNRTGLKAFKERFMLCWERCGGEDPFLSRFVTPGGVGFMFAAMPAGHREWTVNALVNYTQVHKYELKLSSCIGVGFAREGADRLVPWLLLEFPWEPDPAVDALMAKGNPLPPVRHQRMDRYQFRAG